MEEKQDKAFLCVKEKDMHTCLTSQFNLWEVESTAFLINLAVRCWKENSESYTEKGLVENKTVRDFMLIYSVFFTKKKRRTTT